MKLFSSVFLYLFIGGLLIGLAIDQHHDRCGKPGAIEAEDIAIAALWPIAIGAAFVVDNDDLTTGCEK
jgi:hypothetical protein